MGAEYDAKKQKKKMLHNSSIEITNKNTNLLSKSQLRAKEIAET